jgi:hypothetical protein
MTEASIGSLGESEIERLKTLAASYFEEVTGIEGGPEPPGLKLVAERIDRDLLAIVTEARASSGATSTLLDRVVAGFGSLMVQELGLEWAALSSPVSALLEEVVVVPETDIVFYPHRIIRRQLEQVSPMPTLEMVRSARGYLTSLERFFPASI